LKITFGTTPEQKGQYPKQNKQGQWRQAKRKISVTNIAQARVFLQVKIRLLVRFMSKKSCVDFVVPCAAVNLSRRVSPVLIKLVVSLLLLLGFDASLA
jgi:hypothetical protein